jgi:hypothetical protein
MPSWSYVNVMQIKNHKLKAIVCRPQLLFRSIPTLGYLAVRIDLQLEPIHSSVPLGVSMLTIKTLLVLHAEIYSEL